MKLKFSYITKTVHIYKDLYTYISFEQLCQPTSSTLNIISDQRGVRQEVTLITKRGIEAKSYEGVSSLIYCK